MVPCSILKKSTKGIRSGSPLVFFSESDDIGYRSDKASMPFVFRISSRIHLYDVNKCFFDYCGSIFNKNIC